MADTISQKVLFVLFGLFLGAFLKKLNKLTKIPYGPMVMIIAIIWGTFSEYTGQIGQSALSWEDITPSTILLVFIPAITFNRAFGTDWHTFKRELS